MEQQSSSSKVTVEYHDPFSIYDLISPGLLARLPLTTLHWESHAGPLRSIDSLHIDLIPANTVASSTASENVPLSRVNSHANGEVIDEQLNDQPAASSNLPGSSTATAVPGKSRRHQIPGLRQTPYLKLLLLRCDDNETYKAQARKQTRDWVKSHTPPAHATSKTNPQENHDAFEYLIVHVVVPNTAAATQPRISAKGSSTILEKLRADFNGTSRAAVDRVAQIRIGVNDVPYDKLPRVVPAIPSSSYIESAQEHEQSWQDLLQKFKELILEAFDTRVSQYEEDIRAKEAQQSLPGWNFCTFFMLKEGLARGFENVGLVEDSLICYDELAIGLDRVIKEQASSETGPEYGGSFFPYTKDLLADIEAGQAGNFTSNGVLGHDLTNQDLDEIVIGTDRKPYRELILSNNISVFDFHCYIFARQLALLLRMGNAVSSRDELLAQLKEQREAALIGIAVRHPPVQQSQEGEVLTVLSEICQRTLGFLATITRIMMDDLQSGWLHAHGDRELDNNTRQTMGNVINSLTFSVAHQILAQTATKSLPIPPSTLAPLKGEGDDGDKSYIPEPKTMMHPARLSSLVGSPPPRAASPTPFGPVTANSRRAETDSKNGPTFVKTGLEDLAAARGELYVQARHILRQLGRKHGWNLGGNTWDSETGSFDSIDLEDGKSSVTDVPLEVSSHDLKPCGIRNKLLQAALSTEQNFWRLSEILTDKAMRHFSVANHSRSVRAALGDLALLRFHLKDFSGAAAYLEKLVSSSETSTLDDVQMQQLSMYATSLKELGRADDYVQVALKFLTRSVEKARTTSFLKAVPFRSSRIDISGRLTELMEVLPKTRQEVKIPLEAFFSKAEFGNYATYEDSQDKFLVTLRLHYLLPDPLAVDRIRARLRPVRGFGGFDVWLETTSPTTFHPGSNQIVLQSSKNVVVNARHTVTELSICSGSLTMLYADEKDKETKMTRAQFLHSKPILLYQRPSAFKLELMSARNLQLAGPRFLEISIHSGWNDIQSGEISLRTATAGLRLHTSQAQVAAGAVQLIKSNEAGKIRFGAIARNEQARLIFPYSLEHERLQLDLMAEATYTVGGESYGRISRETVKVGLPLAVSVQDVFRQSALYSRFTIASALGEGSEPLKLLGWSLTGSDHYEASNSNRQHTPVTIMRRQPASLVYRIKPHSRAAVGTQRKPQKKALQLELKYICATEELKEAVRNSISSKFAAAKAESSSLLQYEELVVSQVLRQIQSVGSHHLLLLEQEVLTGKISVARRLQTDAFRGLFLGLDDKVTTLLEGWVTEWCSENASLVLRPQSSKDASNAWTITIPVDVPAVSVVHAAELITEVVPKKVNVNEPIAASLTLQHTRMWEARDTSLLERELHFSYELHAPSDTWLLGGKRKGTFSVPPHLDHADPDHARGILPMAFPVVLIPAKEGHLPMPSLEIKLLQQPRVEGGPSAEVATSEVEYKNSAELILVVGDATLTTVSLDASGPGGGALLLDKRARDVAIQG